jgi:hypothetical protein
MTGGSVTDAIKTIREFYNSDQYKNAITNLKSADDFKAKIETLDTSLDYKAQVDILVTINKNDLKAYADNQIEKGTEENETAKSFSVLMIAVTLADIYNIFKTLDDTVAAAPAADRTDAVAARTAAVADGAAGVPNDGDLPLGRGAADAVGN